MCHQSRWEIPKLGEDDPCEFFPVELLLRSKQAIIEGEIHPEGEDKSEVGVRGPCESEAAGWIREFSSRGVDRWNDRKPKRWLFEAKKLRNERPPGWQTHAANVRALAKSAELGF